MSRAVRSDKQVVLGGEPRISLLPPEVAVARRGASLRRALGVVVLVAVLSVGGGVALASAESAEAQRALAVERARTEQLLAEQGEYSVVRVVARQVETTKAARMVGASTEIDWTDYLAQLTGTLPAGTSITEIGVDSATPLEPYAQSTAPLQPQRVATLTITAQMAMLENVSEWLVALRDLPGFTDATPDSVSAAGEGAGFTVELTLHIDAAAFANRFSEKASE